MDIPVRILLRNPMWKSEEGKPTDKFTWVYRDTPDGRAYIAGTAGRIRIEDAGPLTDALNEYSLCVGEGK